MKKIDDLALIVKMLVWMSNKKIRKLNKSRNEEMEKFFKLRIEKKQNWKIKKIE